MAVYDETWKEAMEQWFDPFVAFFFPQVHRDIDWNHGWEWLDAELLIHWMMKLPEALEPLFKQEHHDWEKEKQMPFVTPFER